MLQEGHFYVFCNMQSSSISNNCQRYLGLRESIYNGTEKLLIILFDFVVVKVDVYFTLQLNNMRETLHTELGTGTKTRHKSWFAWLPMESQIPNQTFTPIQSQDYS